MATLRRLLSIAALMLLALAAPARAHDSDDPHAEGVISPESPFWAGPMHSGSWYDPARSGEGIILEFLTDGRAIAFWFTYPATGEAGEQAWLIAQDGVVHGDTIAFSVVYQPKGAKFGDAFDPGDVQRTVWGTLQMKFQGCNAATVTYQGPAGYGTGSRTLTRLTTLDELDCNGNRSLLTNGARALDGIAAKSGTWYVPARSGEGWVLEELPNGQLLVYWFTFDPDGNQAWTIGIGTRQGGTITITDNVITRGTRFGDAFDASKVERLPWGQLTFAFQGCNQGQAAYASTRAGYGSGARAPVRLTQLLGAPCLDAAPNPVATGHWEERASLPPNAQSELAATAYDGKVYAIGGYGDFQALKRYDPATNSWTRLPDAPAGRNHLAAFAFPFERAIYLSGGAVSSGDETYAGYRYDLDTGLWSPVPPLLFNYGSHAAVVGGRAYIGNFDGSLQEYDPRQNQIRTILPRGTTPRDHSQVVAFFDEVWLIDGRYPDQVLVDIYDPVSETWRTGPRTRRAHTGFAAAVVGARVVVAGGEHIFANPPSLEASLEQYSAGAEQFQLLPDEMPNPVHGVAGAAVGNVFYAISGSTQPTKTSGATGRLWAYVFDN